MSRVTLFAGHYGSGKTNIAVNYALMLRRTNERVLIADHKIIQKIFVKLSSKEKEIEEQYSTSFNLELNNCQEQCKTFIYNNPYLSADDNKGILIDKNIINLNEEEEPEKGKTPISEKKFINYFNNKICCDILGLGMIKYFIDKNEIILLSYRILKEIFNCNIIQVKKSIIFIQLYINIIKNI